MGRSERGDNVKKPHDLEAILAEVRERIAYAPSNVQISWSPPEGMTFHDDDCWAKWVHTNPDTHWIGVHESLKCAPLYVVRYLVAHELLHAVFRPRRGARVLHTKPHVVAERLWPDYERANEWLRLRA
jgi:hypothetical protein